MKYSKILTKDFLQKEYLKDKKTAYEIADIIGCVNGTVYWYLKKYNIERREPKIREPQKSGTYIDGKCSKKHTCIESNCNNEITYQGALYGSGRCRECTNKRHGRLLKGRKQSKEIIEKRSKKLRGKNHWNWKGGISPLGHQIRNTIKYKQWHKKVLKRDFWTCKGCKYKGHNLEVHHKKSFVKILKEFLSFYDNFSPIEDKETLVRLSFKWQDFWDINNGITLCVDCHNKIKK